jgi:hypothetical protein
MAQTLQRLGTKLFLSPIYPLLQISANNTGSAN